MAQAFPLAVYGGMFVVNMMWRPLFLRLHRIDLVKFQVLIMSSHFLRQLLVVCSNGCLIVDHMKF